MLESQGKSAAEIAEALRANAATATPMAQAMSGFLGTLITGILVSAIIAIWVRAKGTPARA
jgi:predicted lipid-binding transport protein (Tim44 family)